MLTLYPKRQPWCRLGSPKWLWPCCWLRNHTSIHKQDNISKIPCRWRSWPKEKPSQCEQDHPDQDHWRCHINHNKEAVDGQISPGGSKPWGLLHQSDETEPDWWYACQGLSPSEPELCQGHCQVQTSCRRPDEWGTCQRPQQVLAQRWIASGERNQQGNHYQGRQEGTDRNILPDLRRPNPARTHLPGLWKVWCNTIHPPPQALLQVPAIWPWSTYLPGHWKCLSVVFRNWSQTGWLSKQGVG